MVYNTKNTVTTQGVNGLAIGAVYWNGTSWVALNEQLYFHVNSTEVANSTQSNSGATGTNALAAGAGSTAAGSNAVAVGAGSIADGISAVAVGAPSSALGGTPRNTTASGKASIGLGAGSLASDTGAIAIGDSATASGNYSMAISTGANAKGGHSLAFGNNAVAWEYDVAMGALALTSVTQQGNGTLADTESKGYNTAVGYAAGQKSKGTRNSFLGTEAGADTKGDQTVAIGAWAGRNIEGDSNVAIGTMAGEEIKGNYNVAIGERAGRLTATGDALLTPTGDRNSFIGYYAGGGGFGKGYEAKGNDNLAMGSGALAGANGNDNVAQGTVAGAQVIGKNNVAIGNQAGTYATMENGAPDPGEPQTYSNAVNIGYATKALKDNAVALGSGASTSFADAVAIGSDSVSNTDAGIEGYHPLTATASQIDAIKATASTLAAVSVGDVVKGKFRQITAVAAGTEDSDAVNVSQLKAVQATASAGWNIGNSSAVVGTVAPGSQVNFESGNLANTQVTVTQDATGTSTVSVRAAPGAVQYTAGNTAAGGNTPSGDQFSPADQVTLVGAGGQTGTGVTINNVAPGAVNDASLQAINGSQLYGTADSVAKALGGSLSVGSGGTLTAPSWTFNGKTYTSVYSALDKLFEGWNLATSGSGPGAGGPGGTGTGGPAPVQPGDTVTLNAGNNIVLTQGPKTGNNVTTTIATSMNPVFDTVTTSGLTVTPGSTVDMGGNKVSNVAAGTISNTSSDAINGSQIHSISSSVSNALGGGSIVNPDGSVSAPSYTITTNPGTGASTTVNNVGDALAGLNTAVNQPLTFAGDSGNNVTRKLGSTVNMVGGATGPLTDGNIGVVADGNSTMTVKLAKEVKGLTSISTVDTAGNTTTVSGGGVTVAPAGGGQTVTLGPTGLDNGGHTINNVAPGEISPTSTQAVNGSQLYQAMQQNTGGINAHINNRFNAMSKELNAGIASGIAVASIPQVTRPGAVGVGMGSGTYMGQTGFAVGVSGMTDNGNWIFKGNVITNTSGHVGVGVGVLRQW